MLKDYKLKLIKSNGTDIYSVEGYDVKIEETGSLNKEFYALTTKEILNVLDYFKVLDTLKNIRINNHKLCNTQAYVMPSQEYRFLNLFSLSDGMIEERKRRYKHDDIKQMTLFTLIHEIAHLKGIIPEDEADDFADKHINDVWGSMIKPKRVFV